MEVHYDQDKRKDLVFTIQEDDAGHVEIIIDQQQPPCGDFKQVGPIYANINFCPMCGRKLSEEIKEVSK